MPTENPKAWCYPSMPTDKPQSDLSEGLHSSSRRCLQGSTGSPTETQAVLPRSASWGGNAACSPHSRAAPGPPSSSLLSVGPSPVCPCPSCSAGSRTGRGAPGAAPQVLSRGSPSCNQRLKAPISFLPAFQPPPDAMVPTSGHIVLAEIRATLTTQIHSLSSALP